MTSLLDDKVIFFEGGSIIREDSPDITRRPYGAAIINPRKELRCYEVLGLTRTATSDQVRQAYKKKALEAHPDRPRGGHASFVAIAEAFETLSDSNKRDFYDRELVTADSQDGLKAQPCKGFAPSAETIQYDEEAILDVYRHFMSMPVSGWAQGIKVLDTTLLEGLMKHLESIEKANAVEKMRTDREEIPKESTGRANSTTSAPVLKSAAKGIHLYCIGGHHWCAQITVGGLEVRSKCTNCIGTAAAGHVALLTYKESLLSNSRDERETNFEACSRKAYAKAVAQNIDVESDHFTYCFHKCVKLHGEMRRYRTPSGRDLETALRHRREVLEMVGQGCTNAQIQMRIDRMRFEVSETSMYMIGSLRRIQCVLAGYVQREVEERDNQESSEPKRRRLLGKQSDALMHFRLPWFGQFAKQHGLNRPQLLPHLRSLQECLQRSPHLQECVQSALMKCLEDPGLDHLSGPTGSQHHSDGQWEADRHASNMAQTGVLTKSVHDSYPSGNNGTCNGYMTRISSDEAGRVRVSVSSAPQPHDASGQQEPHHETYARAGVTYPRKLDTQLRDMHGDEYSKGYMEQPYRQGGNTADQLEAPMWSWKASLLREHSHAAEISRARDVEVD